jgi:GntR family transcriptional regulator/MocR family aminotransferase
LDLFVRLDRNSGISLHAQLEDGLRGAIRDGRLRRAVELPSTRALAAELGVARGVVVEGYAQLRAEGYLEVSPRGKTRVADVAQPGPSAPAATAGGGPPLRYDFHPGLPDLDGFPRARWARSLRNAVKDLPGAELGYGDLRGAAVLREALATHLGRARGAVAEADRILITQGFSEGLALACQALRARGARRIAVEDPSLPPLRAIVADAGLEPVPVPVDGEGMRVEGIERIAADAALLTPAHQFPLGAALAPARRAALVEWARDSGAYLIEDDYDAEYRYDRDPVGALQGLAPERVVYGGSASKTLAPALRLGWLLLPEELYAAVLERKAFAGPSPVLPQLALAEWLLSGEFHRHLRRMRLRYRRRRDAIAAALRTRLGDPEIEGIAAGLHVVARLPERIDGAALALAAHERGVGIHPLGWHRVEQAPGESALVLGYAGLGEREIEKGIDLLAELIRA